jgi:hypothetical protein
MSFCGEIVLLTLTLVVLPDFEPLTAGEELGWMMSETGH